MIALVNSADALSLREGTVFRLRVLAEGSQHNGPVLSAELVFGDNVVWSNRIEDCGLTPPVQAIGSTA